MRVLITGGAGFVGSHVAFAVRTHWPGCDVVVMDNLYRRGSELNLPRLKAGGITFHYGDIREPRCFPEGPFDYLVECSAEPSVLAGVTSTPDYLIETNLTGAYHCLEKARSWKAGLVFLSTSRVYPIRRLESHAWLEQPTRFCWSDNGTSGISSRGVREELDMSGAKSLYGFTKHAAEQLIEEYRVAFGLKAVINRCGVLTGPWQFGKVDQGVAALWVLSHQLGRPLAYLGIGGLGKQVRDFLHVGDLCNLLLEQLTDFERWDGWVGNVSGGTPNAASLCELTSLCQEICGRDVPIRTETANRPGDLRIYIGDCSQLFSRTAWRPRRRVRQIIMDLAAWANEHATALQSLNS